MTNPSDDQPDLNQPADAATPPPPSSSEPTQPDPDATRVATPPASTPPASTPPASTPPAPTQPMYGQTYGEQPSNPYGGATFDQNPPVPPAPAVGYGQTPPPHAGGYGQTPPPAYGSPAAYGTMATPDQGATTSMIIGIIGLASILVCCGIGLIASPFALFMGRSAKKRIEASNGSLSGEGQANAGFITGIIGTVFLVLGVLGAIAYVVFMVWLASSGNLDSPSTYDSYDSEF